MTDTPTRDGPMLFAIAPTPYTADLAAVDTRALADNVGRLAEDGIDQVLLTGAYGEFQSLSDDERVAAVRAVAATGEARGIMACAALPSTVATAELGRRMVDAGADLVMVSVPLLAEVSEAEILRHFDELDRRLQGRIVVYNNPIFGVDLRPDLLARLARLPHFAAVKQGTKSLAQLVESISSVHAVSGGRMKVYAASDLTAHVSLPAGADGLTSTNSWIFPSVFRLMVDRPADPTVLRACAEALGPYFAVVRAFGQPRVVKAAMRLRGYAGADGVRLPYVPLDHEETAVLRRALEECDEMVASLPTPVQVSP